MDIGEGGRLGLLGVFLFMFLPMPVSVWLECVERIL